MADPRISIVIITRDRCRDLLEALAHLRELPEAPRVIVVDNASQDGTADAVRREFPAVEVLALDENRGPAARNLGVQHATTPYVAFNDDDSWWEPGALSAAADLLDAHPHLALVNGHILVGPDQRPDPVCLEMAESPLPLEAGQPGRALLSFVACGAIVRRDAFLAVGGFHERLGVGGEEEIVGHRLALAGWQQSYVAEIVTHHHPSTERDHHSRRATQVRNALWTAWITPPAGAPPPRPRPHRGPQRALAPMPPPPARRRAPRERARPAPGRGEPARRRGGAGRAPVGLAGAPAGRPAARGAAAAARAGLRAGLRTAGLAGLLAS